MTTRLEFDALSRRTFLVEDDRQTSQWLYDGASRLVQSINPVGNGRYVTYDQNSNATHVTSVEISPESLVAPEVFESLYVWDSLDRLVRVTDNAGQTATLAYDSRDQAIDSADAVGPLAQDPLGLYTRGPINDAGNTAHTFHDGLGRVTKRVIDLRLGGQGGNALDTSNPASPNGTITTSYMWDGNSRLAYLFDDKGNATHYEFDELDRAFKETAADATFRTTAFDRNGNALSSTDANGTSVARVFDALNRLTSATVTPSTTWHIGGTLSQAFAYDGASRLTKASDTHADARVTEVAYAYDSLSRVLEEKQDGLAVSSAWAGDGRRVGLTYASGTRLDFQHDASKRLKGILDQGNTVAHWDWIGPGMRPLRRAVENGVTLTFLDDTGLQDLGWDSVQRVTRMRYRTAAGTSLVDLGYGYDRASNRTFEARNHENRFDSYTYDSAYRLKETTYNVDPNAVPGALPDGILNVSVEKFTLDGVNNRLKVQQTLDTLNTAGTALKKKTVDSTPNATNEYTQVGNDPQVHDPNGNLLDDGKFTYRYDFRNLLISVEKKATGRLARYRYDALGRRVEKVWGPTAPDPADGQDDPEDDEFTGDTSTQRFVHDGARILEQRNANGGVAREWVYGVGIDEPVRMTKKPHKPAATNYYYLQSAIGSVVAITDAAGNVVERYKYLAFGKEEIYDAAGVKRSGSGVGNPIRWQGRWRDSAEGSPLVYYRARYYDPRAGRFTTRDPIGVWGSRGALGNAYAAFGNNGVTWVDPFGLDPQFYSGKQQQLETRLAEIRAEIARRESRTFPNQEVINILHEREKIVSEMLVAQIAEDLKKGEAGDPTVISVEKLEPPVPADPGVEGAAVSTAGAIGEGHQQAIAGATLAIAVLGGIYEVAVTAIAGPDFARLINGLTNRGANLAIGYIMKSKCGNRLMLASSRFGERVLQHADVNGALRTAGEDVVGAVKVTFSEEAGSPRTIFVRYEGGQAEKSAAIKLVEDTLPRALREGWQIMAEH